MKKAKIVEEAAADGGEPDVSNKAKPSAAQKIFGTGIWAASAGQRETPGKSIADTDFDKEILAAAVGHGDAPQPRGTAAKFPVGTSDDGADDDKKGAPAKAQKGCN